MAPSEIPISVREPEIVLAELKGAEIDDFSYTEGDGITLSALYRLNMLTNWKPWKGRD